MTQIKPFFTTALLSAAILEPSSAFSVLKMQSSYTPQSQSTSSINPNLQRQSMSPTTGVTSSHDLFSGTSTTQSSSSEGRTFSVEMSPTSRYFQLEEREDKESCTTEIFLREDGTVAVFDTDGPPPTKASGFWSHTHDASGKSGSFNMNIVRTFTTGSDGREMGEFTFDVERKFEGMLSMVGAETLAMEGSIHLVDEFRGDISVGYFSMIDTTKAKLGGDDSKDSNDDDDFKYQMKTTI